MSRSRTGGGTGWDDPTTSMMSTQYGDQGYDPAKIQQVMELTGGQVTFEQAQLVLERCNWRQDEAIQQIYDNPGGLPQPGSSPQSGSFSQNVQRSTSGNFSQQNIQRNTSGSFSQQNLQNSPGAGSSPTGQIRAGIPRSVSNMTNPSGAVDQGGYGQGTGSQQLGGLQSVPEQGLRPQAAPRPSVAPAVAKLRLTVVAAFDLMNTSLGLDSLEGSDPFVVARLGTQTFQTATKRNDLNPKWNETFDFDVLDLNDELQLQVMNSNNYQAHDVLGQLVLPIRNSVENPGQERRNGREALAGDQKAKIEIELVYLTADMKMRLDQEKQMSQGYPQGPPQYSHVQSYNVNQYNRPRNWLPLPRFDQDGVDAFLPPSAAPARQAGYANSQSSAAPENPDAYYRRPNYESRACHLGQHDYSKDPTHFPKQERVDKKQWSNDPFYGWRNDADQRGKESHSREHHSRDNSGHSRDQYSHGSRDRDGASPSRGVERSQGSVERSREDFEPPRMEMEQWQRDPFHGWLTQSQHVSGDGARLREAQNARQLMTLPSFSEEDKTRFNDNRDYVGEVRHDARQRHVNPATPLETEKGWKDDAFYAWLPGRGPGAADKHTMYRPNNAARLERLPSFSEASSHLKGRGLGLLHVWVKNASGLFYPDSSGKRGKPNACVRLRFAKTEVMTNPIENSSNPVWNTNEFVFEVPSEQEDADPELSVDVLDMPTTSVGRGQKDFVLGRMTVPVRAVIHEYELTQKRMETNKPKREVAHLIDPQREVKSNAKIEIDLLFDPYDSLRHTHQHQPHDQHGQHGQHTQHSQHRTRGMNAAGSKGIGKLEVIVKRAYNLVNKDTGLFGDVSDPYVFIKLQSQSDKDRHRTVTKSNDLNPVWNAGPYSFDIMRQHDELELTIMDEDLLSSDDFLGEMKIPLERVIAHHGRGGLTIRDKLNNIEHGELEVKLTYIPNR